MAAPQHSPALAHEPPIDVHEPGVRQKPPSHSVAPQQSPLPEQLPPSGRQHSDPSQIDAPQHSVLPLQNCPTCVQLVTSSQTPPWQVPLPQQSSELPQKPPCCSQQRLVTTSHCVVPQHSELEPHD